MTRLSAVFATASPGDQHRPRPRRAAAPFAIPIVVGDGLNPILGPPLAIVAPPRGWTDSGRREIRFDFLIVVVRNRQDRDGLSYRRSDYALVRRSMVAITIRIAIAIAGGVAR